MISCRYVRISSMENLSLFSAKVAAEKRCASGDQRQRHFCNDSNKVQPPVDRNLLLSLVCILTHTSQTLLNILGGRATYGQMDGDIFLNGKKFEPHKQRHLIGYVPQAHILYKELTVFENLAYAAELRLHRDIAREDREALVENALVVLGLSEVRHFVCDPTIGERLSGGQMRRIGIGIELVAGESIEPSEQSSALG